MANALDPSRGIEQENWREQLSRDHRDPEETISYREAIAHRLRRVYLRFLLGLFVIWLFHLSVYGSAERWTANAAIEGVPGIIVVAAVLAFYAAVLGVAFVPDTGGETSEADHAELEQRR